MDFDARYKEEEYFLQVFDQWLDQERSQLKISKIEPIKIKAAANYLIACDLWPILLNVGAELYQFILQIGNNKHTARLQPIIMVPSTD